MSNVTEIVVSGFTKSTDSTCRANEADMKANAAAAQTVLQFAKDPKTFRARVSSRTAILNQMNKFAAPDTKFVTTPNRCTGREFMDSFSQVIFKEAMIRLVETTDFSLRLSK